MIEQIPAFDLRRGDTIIINGPLNKTKEVKVDDIKSIGDGMLRLTMGYIVDEIFWNQEVKRVRS